MSLSDDIDRENDDLDWREYDAEGTNAAFSGFDVAPADAPCCPECESYTRNGCGAGWHDTAPEEVPFGCLSHGWDLCGLCNYTTKRRIKDDPRG